MKVRDEIIGENHSKAASDENGTEHDIAETDKKEIKKELEIIFQNAKIDPDRIYPNMASLKWWIKL